MNGNRARIIFRYGLIGLCMLLASGYIVSYLVDNTITHADEWNQKAQEVLAQSEIILLSEGISSPPMVAYWLQTCDTIRSEWIIGANVFAKTP